MKPNAERSPSPAGTIDLSFVVIGYNEAGTLKACLDSVRNADLDGLSWELIYVDGGSIDTSMDIAREAGVDRLLGGETRRRAAENRNLGLEAATGDWCSFWTGTWPCFPTGRAPRRDSCTVMRMLRRSAAISSRARGSCLKRCKSTGCPGRHPALRRRRDVFRAALQRRAGFHGCGLRRSRCYAGACATRMTGKSIR